MIRMLTSVVMVMLVSGCITEIKGPHLKADPVKSLQSYIDLGIGYIRNGQYQRAKDNLNKALALDSRSAQAHDAFGLLFQFEGELELAERHFKRAVSIQPDLSRARNNYGAFLFEQKRYDEAIKQLKEAAKDPFYPARPQAFENLGVCYLHLGELAQAEDAFSHAVGLNATQPRALLELAELKFKKQDFTGAKGHFERYRKIMQPSSKSLWLGIRIARVFDEKDDEASQSMLLRNIFPATEEHKAYRESLP